MVHTTLYMSVGHDQRTHWCMYLPFRRPILSGSRLAFHRLPRITGVSSLHGSVLEYLRSAQSLRSTRCWSEIILRLRSILVQYTSSLGGTLEKYVLNLILASINVQRAILQELAFRSAILYGGLLISNAFGSVSSTFVTDDWPFPHLCHS